MRSRPALATGFASRATYAAALLALSLAAPANATAGRASEPPFAVHYRTIEQAYRKNQWSLLNKFVTSDFRYVEVDGTPKSVAGLERDAATFAKQGGRIRSASVRVTRVGGEGTTRIAMVTVTLDVNVGRPGASSRVAQVDVDRDTWRRAGERWLLSHTAVTSEAVTRFGSPSRVQPAVHSSHERPPDLRHEYTIIDRAFRESRWDLVRPFATKDARFVEVDGSPKTLDELSAAGKAFTNGGGVATATHMVPIHVVRIGDDVTVAVLTTAAGTYPAGTRRVRFAQRVAQQDSWKRSDGRWLYAGGRILRQTITTFAAGKS